MHSDSCFPSVLSLLKLIEPFRTKKKKKILWAGPGRHNRGRSLAARETASCPVKPGWLCDKAGALTAQGERHVLKRGCLHRQQFGASGLHGLCFLGLILSKFIYYERTKVVLQLVLSVRNSLQCAWLLVTWRHRNQTLQGISNVSHPFCT